MSGLLLDMTSSIWKNEICQYLRVSDTLALRAVSRRTHAFITSLLLELAAANRAHSERLQASEAFQKGAAKVKELQPQRELIADARVQMNDLVQLTSYMRPPASVLDSLQAVVGLKSGQESLSWNVIRGEIRSASFLPDLVSFFCELAPKNISSALRTQTETLQVQQVLMSSSACGELLQMAQTFLALQDGLQHAEAREWFRIQQRTAEIRSECAVLERVIQGMPDSVREQRKAKEMKKAGKLKKTEKKAESSSSS